MEKLWMHQLICVIALIACRVGGEFTDTKFSVYPSITQEGPSINKVTFTQRGYIQFLKYIKDVPEIKDFTSCIWINSVNLTYPHPLLSYSKDEKQRYLRLWLSAKGKDVVMTILETEVFKVPVHLFENHWHHICTSWSSKRATWQVFINGKLRDTGITSKLKDVSIPAGGDIVVGQEYTDFDKGLDDGIEGDVFGFNMVLASTLPPKSQAVDFGRRRQIYIPGTQFILPAQRHDTGYQVKEVEESYGTPVVDIPAVLSYFKTSPIRQPKGLVDIGRAYLRDFYNILEPNPRIRVNSLDFLHVNPPFYARQKVQTYPARPVISTKRVYSSPSLKNEVEGSQPKPLGLLLVELGYNRCALGRGSPIDDSKVLVSWTKTPVRVFGGAILKTVKPFCRKF